MKLSNFFCPIIKEAPKEATLASHSLMLRAGLIRQTASGIYAFLPLGKIVLDKITTVVKQEMDKSGACEMLMPTIQLAELWEESGRYDSYGAEMLKIEDRHNRKMLYGPTNEEQITQIFRDNVKSYKNLPLNLYHIQWKFRDEIRPRFGLLRGREFLMKDAYSFDLTEDDSKQSYYNMFFAYLNIFKRLQLKAIPMKAESGEIGGDLSHEFVILSKTGESEVYFDNNILKLYDSLQNTNYDSDLEEVFKQFTSFYAATDEMFDENDEFYKKSKANVIQTKGIEVGHVFYFGTKYSEPLKALVLNKDGQNVPVHMGSYGVGISRLAAAIVEANYDEKGIVWPYSLAPFKVIINSLGNKDDVSNLSNDIYKQLKNNNVEVIFNNLKESVGSKLATADLLGFPLQVNVGNNAIENNEVEIKQRKSGEIVKATKDQTVATILKILEQLS